MTQTPSSPDSLVAALSPWQADLLRRLIAKAELNEDDWQEVEENLGAHVSGSALVHGEALESLPGRAKHGKSCPTLKSLREIEHVGALRAGTALDFEPNGLTLVFGDNGSGKTTFSRLLKETCRTAAHAGGVLSNVFEAAAAPSFAVEFSIDGRMEKHRRTGGESPIAELADVGVFDAMCASHYVSSDVEAAFVPSEMQIFERLHRALQELQGRLDKRTEGLKAERPRFDELEGSLAARVRQTLTPIELRALTAEANDASETVETLRKTVETMRSLDKKQKTKRAELSRWIRRRDVFQKLASNGVEPVATLKAAKAGLDSAEDALSKANEMLGDFIVGGVGTAIWQAMWTAAERHTKECGTEEHCALCQRKYDEETKVRIQHFARIARREVETQRQRARQAHDEAMQQVMRMRDGLLKYAEEHAENIIDGDVPALRRAAQRSTAALEGTRVEEPAVDDALVGALAALNARCTQAKSELATLDALEPSELSAHRNRLKEAEQLSALAQRIADLEDAHKIDVEVDANIAARKAVGLTRLSRDIGQLADTLMTGRLQEEFKRALTDLHVSHLPLQMKSMARKGQPKTKLELRDAHTTDPIRKVFSTGEQNAAAIAFFLAEAAAAEHDGPLVFDDPMSSLDASRREAVAVRLAEEAKRRQVIVFTHDSVFASLLQDRFRRAGPKVYWRCVRNFGGKAGFVDSGQPLVCCTADNLEKKLRSELKQGRKFEKEENIDSYVRVVCRFHDILRKAYERLVVEKVLGGVLVPGTFEVHTRELKKVGVSDEAAKLIHAGMTEASFRKHDQGSAMPMHTPRLEELEAKLERFSDARAACSKKQPRGPGAAE